MAQGAFNDRFHTEVIGDSRFTILNRYSNLRAIGSGAQGYVV